MEFALKKYNFRFKKDDQGSPLVFDEVRKKWLKITPEEFVRQNWVHYLIFDLNYPSSILSLEAGLKVKGQKRRSDLVVYRDSKPFILIECKAEKIPVDQKVLDQALRYNSTLNARFLVLSNGNESRLFDLLEGTLKEINHLPFFSELKSL